MKIAIFLLAASMCMTAQARYGTRPKASAEQYAAHAELNGLNVGASLLAKSDFQR